MGAAVDNVPASSVNLDPRLFTDDNIPELVHALLLTLLKPEPKPPRVVHRIHRCTCCEATWDEDA